MTTAASLKTQTAKDLGQMAKNLGVPGWHAMRKDELVRALVRASKKSAPKKRSPKAKASSTKSRASSRSKPKAKAPAKPAKKKPARRAASSKTKASTARRKPAPKPAPKPKSSHTVGKIRRANAQRTSEKDLTTDANGKKLNPKAKKQAPVKGVDLSHQVKNGALVPNGKAEKDRIVLLVRDSFWLQACWELSRRSVERAQVAMAEFWHTAKPVLRVLEVDSGTTTNTVERVVRDIPIHGGVKNWYIDVKDPPNSYRVAIGYLTSNSKFYTLARSNIVSTPPPGSSDSLDQNWTDVAQNYEQIFALSGGYSEESETSELQELFEERLRRPMGSPSVTKFGLGAEAALNKEREFKFDVDAEMIIYGSTKPDAHVTLSGEPVKLRPDGSFTVRLSMPDRRQVLPVVASSRDGVEQRTIVLAVERNTKVLEPIVHQSGD